MGVLSHMSTNFFPETLPTKTAILLAELRSRKLEFLNQFYLSGGTALSLQLGHRESEDLDFFSETDFETLIIEQELEKVGKLESRETFKNTLNCVLRGVKLQFLGYPYPLLEPFVGFEELRLSSVIDIACTKLQTIGARGSKKDFIDLYIIFETYTLQELLDLMKRKYVNTDFSLTHILKSLIYFEDAELEPMPRLHRDIEWEDVKKKMGEVVKGTSL